VYFAWMIRIQVSTFLCSSALVALAAPLFAQTQAAPAPKPEDTEIWEPAPKVVTPGPAVEAAPPSDAIVLFDGKSLGDGEG